MIYNPHQIIYLSNRGDISKQVTLMISTKSNYQMILTFHELFSLCVWYDMPSYASNNNCHDGDNVIFNT